MCVCVCVCACVCACVRACVIACIYDILKIFLGKRSREAVVGGTVHNKA